MKNYCVTVTMYIDGKDEDDVRETIYDVLDVAYNGIDNYSIDGIDELYSDED